MIWNLWDIYFSSFLGAVNCNAIAGSKIFVLANVLDGMGPIEWSEIKKTRDPSQICKGAPSR